MLLAYDDKNNELVKAETADRLPNVVEFTKMAKAIDNINVSSELSVEDWSNFTDFMKE